MTGNKKSALGKWKSDSFFQMSALKKPKLQEAEGIYAYVNYG